MQYILGLQEFFKPCLKEVRRMEEYHAQKLITLFNAILAIAVMFAVIFLFAFIAKLAVMLLMSIAIF